MSLDDLNVQTLAFKAIGYIEKIEASLKGTKNEGTEVQTLMNYVWSYETKDVAILLRNILLKLLKLEQYERDGLRSAEEVVQYKSIIQSTLHTASFAVLASHEHKTNKEGRIDEDWEHEDNPVETILAQLATIKTQIKKIQRSQHKLDLLNEKFSDYRTAHVDLMEQRRSRVNDIYDSMQVYDQTISDYGELLQKKEIVGAIKKLETFIHSMENQVAFSSYEYILVEDTDRLLLPVMSDRGNLVSKSVDILSEISGWNSFTLAAPLKAIDTRIHSQSERVIAILYQMLNRLAAKLDSGKEEAEIVKSDMLTPLRRLMTQYREEVVDTTNEKLDDLEEQLTKYINPSQIFSQEHNFLPSSALDQLAGYTEYSNLERRYSLNNIKSNIQKFVGGIFSKYTKKEELTTAGFIDRILCFNPESDVNALFLRKGFLGSTFTVDRTEIDYKLRNHYKLWESGYGGSILIKGGHGTGRSTVLEILPLLHTEVTSHHFVPGQKIYVNGHKHTVDYDLIKAIKFVVKHTGQDRCMITIDDLEYYTNTTEATYDVVQKLMEILAKNNKKIYFAVAMHKYLDEHVRDYFDIENIFTEVISTDHMAARDIEEAVVTRAHAVANYEEAMLKSDEITAMARRVSLRANHNIGRAMQYWCMCYNGDFTEVGKSEKFVTTVEENRSLIKTIFKHGHLYEPFLRSMLNEVDARNLKYDIQSLIGSRLLIRPQDGYITVNPYLQSTVEAILDKEN